MRRFGLVLVLVLGGGCAPRALRPPQLPVQDTRGLGASVADALSDALIDGRRAIAAPGVSQVMLRGEQRWAGATGWAVRNERRAVPEDVYRIGSITKTYVAAVLVSLHVEGVLDLDDPVSRWVPEAPHGDRYTLRQALAHQTGLPDFVRTPRFAFNLGRRESIRELLSYVDDRDLQFEPGREAKYSNTNYLVAGLAIEAATGRPWGEEVRSRLLAPLGLEHTWIPSIEPEPEDIVRGYVGAFDVTTRFEPSRASAGGEIVATADDVARFAQALFFGDLVDPAVRELMVTEVPTLDGESTGRGLGTKITETPHGRLIGHSGSTVSFQSRMHVHEESGTVVVSLANSFFSEADELDERAWAALAAEGALTPRPFEGPDTMVAGHAGAPDVDAIVAGKADAIVAGKADARIAGKAAAPAAAAVPVP